MDAHHTQPSKRWRLYSRLVLALCIILAVTLSASGQTGDDASDETSDGADAAAATAMEAEAEADERADDIDGETAESDMAMDEPALDVESIVILTLHTYELGWVRYYNDADYGAPLLADETITQFPFRAVSTSGGLGVSDFADAALMGALFQEYDFSFDETLVQGICDTARLREYNSGDIYCVPGTSAMAPGYVTAVLYHPQTHEIVAMTSTIDNVRGAATRYRAPVAQQTAGDGAGCGPYNNGQWVEAADYQAAGLSLTVNTETLLGEITHYRCIVPASGAPYLEAWTVMPGGGAHDAASSSGDMSGSGAGSGRAGSGGDGDDDGGGNRPSVGGNWRLVHDDGGGILRYTNGQGRCRIYNRLGLDTWDFYEFPCLDE